MLNSLERDRHKASSRQRQIQSSASMKECALLKKLLQKPACHCPDWSHAVGRLRNQQLKNGEEMAFVSDNLPISTSGPVEKQIFPRSTRCSNSK
jgi:hypothetical protein